MEDVNALSSNIEFLYRVKLDFKKTKLIEDRRYMLHKFHNCFVGSEFIKWMMKTYNLPRYVCVNVGKAMVERKLCSHVTNEHDFEDEYLFYRFYDDDNHRRILNSVVDDTQPCSHPLDLSGQMLCILVSLMKFHQGNTLEIKSSAEYDQIGYQASRLQKVKKIIQNFFKIYNIDILY